MDQLTAVIVGGILAILGGFLANLFKDSLEEGRRKRERNKRVYSTLSVVRVELETVRDLYQVVSLDPFNSTGFELLKLRGFIDLIPSELLDSLILIHIYINSVNREINILHYELRRESVSDAEKQIYFNRKSNEIGELQKVVIGKIDEFLPKILDFLKQFA